MSDRLVLIHLAIGKAPRKQLAAKSAARKTAVRLIFLSFLLDLLLTRHNTRLQLVAWRSPIASAPEPSLFVRSGGIRNQQNSSSANSPSNVLSVKSHRISKSVLPFFIFLTIVDNTLLADGPALPVVRRDGTSRSGWSLPCLAIRRHQSCRYPRQASHYPT